MWWIYITFLFLVFWLVLNRYKLYLRVKNQRDIPGPVGVPWIGNALQINFDQLQHVLLRWAEQYGEIFQIKILGRKIVVLNSAYLIQRAFLVEPNRLFLNDRTPNATKYVFYGRKHIGLADWTKETIFLRKLHTEGIQHFFDGNEGFESRISLITEETVSQFLQKGGKSLNPDNIIRTYVARVYTHLLIGEESLRPEYQHGVLIWKYVELLFTLALPSIDIPLKMVPFLRHLPLKYRDVIQQTISARENIADSYLKAHKASYNPMIVRGLVDLCLRLQSEDLKRSGSTWFTDEYVMGLIGDTLAAGLTETTKTLRLFLLLICQHQICQGRIRTEVERVLGKNGRPTPQARRQMPYTLATMFELFRYGSQTPLAIPHLCNKDVYLDGYLIEEGTTVFPNLWAVHHDNRAWDDPWVFRPERFLDKSGKLLPLNSANIKTLIPFGVGSRQCPGREFAKSRTFLFMTSILQHMQIVPAETGTVPSADPRLYTTNYPLTEPKFECRFLPRKC